MKLRLATISSCFLVFLFACGCSSCEDPIYPTIRSLQAQLGKGLPQGTSAKSVEEYLIQHHIGYNYRDPTTIQAANYDAIDDVVSIPLLFSYHRRSGWEIVFSFDNDKRLIRMEIEPVFFWL